jgi:hypothetical protein
MRNIEESKRQREQALESWKKELRRLVELERSQRERAQQAALELQRQKIAVSEARARYDRANDEFVNRSDHFPHRRTA